MSLFIYLCTDVFISLFIYLIHFKRDKFVLSAPFSNAKKVTIKKIYLQYMNDFKKLRGKNRNFQM